MRYQAITLLNVIAGFALTYSKSWKYRRAGWSADDEGQTPDRMA
jgi:hypothetical protein